MGASSWFLEEILFFSYINPAGLLFTPQFMSLAIKAALLSTTADTSYNSEVSKGSSRQPGLWGGN